MEKFKIENYKDENGAYDLRKVPIEQMEDVYKALTSEYMIVVDKRVMDDMVDIFPEED